MRQVPICSQFATIFHVSAIFSKFRSYLSCHKQMPPPPNQRRGHQGHWACDMWISLFRSLGLRLRYKLIIICKPFILPTQASGMDLSFGGDGFRGLTAAAQDEWPEMLIARLGSSIVAMNDTVGIDGFVWADELPGAHPVCSAAPYPYLFQIYISPLLTHQTDLFRVFWFFV